VWDDAWTSPTTARQFGGSLSIESLFDTGFAISHLRFAQVHKCGASRSTDQREYSAGEIHLGVIWICPFLLDLSQHTLLSIRLVASPIQLRTTLAGETYESISVFRSREYLRGARAT